MKLGTIWTGFLTVLISVTGMAQTTDYSQCVDKKRSAWGEECTQCPIYRDSYVVYIQNICDKKLDLQIAVQEEDKSWKVFAFNAVAPLDSVRAYACMGKGKYLAWAKEAGDSKTTFPSKMEINQDYKD